MPKNCNHIRDSFELDSWIYWIISDNFKERERETVDYGLINATRNARRSLNDWVIKREHCLHGVVVDIHGLGAH